MYAFARLLGACTVQSASIDVHINSLPFFNRCQASMDADRARQSFPSSETAHLFNTLNIVIGRVRGRHWKKTYDVSAYPTEIIAKVREYKLMRPYQPELILSERTNLWIMCPQPQI